MALYFRNQVTGREVEVLEPDELGEKLATVRRRGKPIDKARIKVAQKHRKQLLDKMNDSWKWERIERSKGQERQPEQGRQRPEVRQGWRRPDRRERRPEL